MIARRQLEKKKTLAIFDPRVKGSHKNVAFSSFKYERKNISVLPVMLPFSAIFYFLFLSFYCYVDH